MIDFKNKIVFVHIGKTGGSSITASLLKLQNIDHNGHHFGQKLKSEFRAGHASAIRMKSNIENVGEKWEDFYKFTIIRNPYTRLVSHYYWFGYNQKMSFRRYLTSKDILKDNVPTMYEYIHDSSGNLLVDDIYRFEDGFGAIYKKIESKIGQKLVKNHAKNNNKRSSTNVFDELATKIINEKYNINFKTFGYNKV